MGEKLRLRFSKLGRIKFISHLDLMATMRRALLRAGIALKYSEGFNPHPYMSVALPLSVGHESLCELMDVGFAEPIATDGLPANITAVLPEGLEIHEVYEPKRKFNEIAWVEIMGALYYDGGIPQDITGRLSERFSEESIIVSKKTKRGIADLDIAPFIRDIEFGCSDAGTEGHSVIQLSAKISAQNPTINPENLMSALDGKYCDLAPDFTGFRRLEVFDKEMNVFR